MGIRDMVNYKYKIIGKPCKYKGFRVLIAKKMSKKHG